MMLDLFNGRSFRYICILLEMHFQRCAMFLSNELANIVLSWFSVKFQHRRSSYKELQYICDGDSNGILYFAGTSYGEHPWVNPVLSKVKFSILFLYSFIIQLPFPYPPLTTCFRELLLQLVAPLQDTLIPRFWYQELTRYDESKPFKVL